MRLFFVVTALAVVSSSLAKNATLKTKPKRQLDNLGTPQHLKYSLVLPHSRVSQYRALNSNRRISNISPRSSNLPPYAVQMEPVVQYSQKDPLYDPTLESLDEVRNDIFAQPKAQGGDINDGNYGPPYGSLPTAPLYSHEPQPHYYEAPEPIIEIIIKESNETLPAPAPTPVPKKKKEPVQVFYVKYSKDPHSHDKVVYDKPIPAITPPTNHQEDDHHEDYVTVTPEPYYAPAETTTLRAIIKPDSEVYHSDSSVKVTFGSEGHHSQYSDRREGNTHNEEREETAPRPAIAYPLQQHQNRPSIERASQSKSQFSEGSNRPQNNHENVPAFKIVPYSQSNPQQAQSRIQFQPSYLGNEQQLPRQGPSVAPFRGPVQRQNNFPNFPLLNAPFPKPNQPFANNPPWANNAPQFHQRPPTFAPRPHFNGPPRQAFHSGPQRPFPQQPQPQAQNYFDEAKYLQENYHTITTDQVEPAKDQPLPRPQQSFNFVPKPTPPQQSFADQQRQPHVPVTQLLPQQRPFQQFVENKPFGNTPNRPPFFNLKPSPPHIEESPIQFQQPSPQFGFHQSGPRPTPPSNQRFPGPLSVSPSPQPIPQTQFLPQPASPPQFNYHAHPSPPQEQQNLPSEKPHFQFNGPSERPFANQHNNFQDQGNLQHQQNVGQFVPNGGELIAAIPKYEQHITVSGGQSDYSGLIQHNQPTPAPSQAHIQYHQHEQRQQQLQHHQQQQQNQQQQEHNHQNHQQQQHHQHQQHVQQQHQLQHQQRQEQQQQQNQHNQQNHQQQHQQQQQQQQLDAEQEQVRLQLAQNVQKQQEEIQRLQSQLLIAQQQQQQRQQDEKNQLQQYHRHQHAGHFDVDYRQLHNFNQQNIEASSVRPNYSQERSRPTPQSSFGSSTASPPYYQSTSRTVEIKPTTQKYVSSTINSINPTKETKKDQKKKKPAIELPDEVPDDLRQQLLSSGILDNADISVLDYDKVGDTPLDSLPPDQLANFFSAGGAQQIAASESRPIVVAPNGDEISSRIDDEDEYDQEIAASENIPTYESAPSQNQAVEMKVVHFDPSTKQGQEIAKDYVKKDATQLEPVSLNDKKYNRYLPLKVSGNQFPLPDILKGRRVTSVVVLAPVETELLNNEKSRSKRATNSLKGIKFVAGDSLYSVLKRPTRENFEKWLKTEKNTAADLQSVVLLVTGTEDDSSDKEIFMYDISSGNVNKLSGDLSSAFVEAAENNSLSRDIEKLAIEGEGTPENFDKSDEIVADGSEKVPLLVDISGLSLDRESGHQISISSGYSKTKLGRSLRKH